MLHIVLVNYNGTSDTINCINSIIESNKFGKCSIKIFDNHSCTEEVELLQSFLARKNCNEFVLSIDCYFSERNLGFAAGNNYWLHRVGINDYVWFLNNDTLTNENLFFKIFQSLPTDNAVAYFDCRTFENEFHDNGMHYVNLISGRYHSSKKSKYDCGYISGASLLIKKTDKTPYWDENYFLYYEDGDYNMRLKNQEFIFVHIDDCYFQHKISSSTNKSKSINIIKMRSQIIFMKKYGKSYISFLISKIMNLLIKLKIKELLAFCRLLIKM